MRLHTARQAWHDCYFVGGDSPIARLIEEAALGAHIQNTAFHNSNNRACHIAQAGKVQSAIHGLPLELQIVGNWLYAPLTTDQASTLAEEVQEILWQKSGLLLNGKARERAYYLIRAAMSDYQDLALGRKMRLETPQNIRKWLLDCHGVELKYGRNWWPRDIKPLWSRMWVALDDLDAAALAPVSKIVRKELRKAAKIII